MKGLLLGSILCFAVTNNFAFTTPEEDGTAIKAIVDAVEAFAQHADEQNKAKMEKVLHKDFRAVVNRLFGSEEVSIMDKASYLSLLEAKKIGGDKRSVTINSVDVKGNNAYVQATFEGKALIFKTYILLVQEPSGDWKIINDMPVIEKLEE